MRGGQPGAEETTGLEAVGDLMAGLLVLFMLLAMVFALSLSRTEASHYTELDALTRAAADGEALRSTIAARLTDQGVPVSIGEAPGVLLLGEGAIRFDAGQHAATDTGSVHAISALATALAEVLPGHACLDGACPEKPAAALESVLIEGHSDAVDRLAACDNHCLSARRAAWTLRQLLAREPGLSALENRAGDGVFGVTGYGPLRSRTGLSAEVCRADPAACAEDRRIEVRLRMEAPSHWLVAGGAGEE